MKSSFTFHVSSFTLWRTVPARSVSLIALLLMAVGAAQPATAADTKRTPVRVYDCPAVAGLSDVAISPDERLLAEAVAELGADGKLNQTVRVLDIRWYCAVARALDRASDNTRPSKAPGRRVLIGLHFTFDSGLLVYSDGPTLRVLRANPLSQVWQFEVSTRGHPTLIRNVAVARDAYVAAIVVRPEPVRQPSGDPQLMQRPEFEHLLRAYDLRSGAVKSDVKLPAGSTPLALALSPDGRRAALAIENAGEALRQGADLWIVETATGRVVGQHRVEPLGAISFADNNTVVSLARTARGDRRMLKVVDATSGAVLRQIVDTHDDDAFANLGASASSRYVAAPLHRAAEVRGEFAYDEFGVWEIATGELVARVKTPPVAQVKLSRSGKFLVAGTRILELDLGSTSSGR